MKSTDVRNWKHVLDYTEIVALTDFDVLLTHAITKDECLLCNNGRVEQMGLCESCRQKLSEKERESVENVSKNYEVTVTVKKRY